MATTLGATAMDYIYVSLKGVIPLTITSNDERPGYLPLYVAALFPRRSSRVERRDFKHKEGQAQTSRCAECVLHRVRLSGKATSAQVFLTDKRQPKMATT